jgi:hypothetical protein
MYQAANSMRKMAEQSGAGGAGGAGGAMELGMGAGMGMLLPGFLQKAMDATASPNPTDAGRAPGSPAMANVGALTASKSDPQALVRQVAVAAGWKVDETAGTWDVTIPIGPLRKQVVRVRFDRRDDAGHALISMSSTCGPAGEETAMALLRYNGRMVHAAFAIEATESGEMIVMEANQLADTADALEITRALTALAWQADQAEQQLTSGDTF